MKASSLRLIYPKIISNHHVQRPELFLIMKIIHSGGSSFNLRKYDLEVELPQLCERTFLDHPEGIHQLFRLICSELALPYTKFKQ